MSYNLRKLPKLNLKVGSQQFGYVKVPALMLRCPRTEDSELKLYHPSQIQYPLPATDGAFIVLVKYKEESDKAAPYIEQLSILYNSGRWYINRMHQWILGNLQVKNKIHSELQVFVLEQRMPGKSPFAVGDFVIFDELTQAQQQQCGLSHGIGYILEQTECKEDLDYHHNLIRFNHLELIPIDMALNEQIEPIKPENSGNFKSSYLAVSLFYASNPNESFKYNYSQAKIKYETELRERAEQQLQILQGRFESCKDQYWENMGWGIHVGLSKSKLKKERRVTSQTATETTLFEKYIKPEFEEKQLKLRTIGATRYIHLTWLQLQLLVPKQYTIKLTPQDIQLKKQSISVYPKDIVFKFNYDSRMSKIVFRRVTKNGNEKFD